VVVDTMPAQVEAVRQQRAAAPLNLVVEADIPVQFTPRHLTVAVDLAADIKAVVDMKAAVADTGKLA